MFGTHWHGLLDNNDVRRDWLTAARPRDAVSWSPTDVDVPGRRDAQLDLMADLLAEHADTSTRSSDLLDAGPPQRRP